MATPAKKKSRRLGKGLQSLLGSAVEVVPPDNASQSTQTNVEQNTATATASVSPLSKGAADKVEPRSGEKSVEPSEGLVYVDVDSLAPNARQPRQVFDDDGLSALADSIQNAGLMQPIISSGVTCPVIEPIEFKASRREAEASSGVIICESVSFRATNVFSKHLSCRGSKASASSFGVCVRINTLETFACTIIRPSPVCALMASLWELFLSFMVCTMIAFSKEHSVASPGATHQKNNISRIN